MKLIIPPKCQIGAHIFKIRWSDKWLDARGVRGHEDCRDQMIRLHTGQSASAAFEALIHELDHVVGYTYGIESEEAEVIARTAGLCQSLMSLGIEPDFSQIPKEIF